jgi:hypothetical protein
MVSPHQGTIMIANRPRPPGRYNQQTIRVAADVGLGAPAPSLRIRTAIVAVQDPYPDADGRRGYVRATVNRVADILELERSHGRLDEAEYQIGRQIQRTYERARGPGSSNWRGGDRIAASVAVNNAIERGVEAAQAITALDDKLRRDLGEMDAMILRRILGEGRNYRGVAAMTGPETERRAAYIAERFRDALRALSNRWAAVGAGRSRE